MSLLNAIPALIKMTAVFFLILIAIRRNLSLGTAFVTGALFLGLIFQMSPIKMAESFYDAAVDPKTLSLAAIVSLILILSRCMETAGSMQRLLDNFRGLVQRPRINLIIFPALIGLLPMPGGAVFSAPMVKEIGGRYTLSGDKLSFINYWFRHIWEYWWPMYPGVLLATLMADINLALFVIAMFPLTFVAVFLGWLPVNMKGLTPVQGTVNNSTLKAFMRELLPIIIVIVPGLGLGMVFSTIWPNFSIAKEIGLICALILAIGWIYAREGFTPVVMAKRMTDRHLLKMIYMVMAILVFKGILNDSHAVVQISREFIQLNIPLALISAFLPFIVGLFTGITIAFVGSTFPILISLVQSYNMGDIMLPYIMLGLTAGFAGVLLSPLHLCLLLSNEYFEAAPGSVYRLLWLPCAGLLMAAAGYFLLLNFIWRGWV